MSQIPPDSIRDCGAAVPVVRFAPSPNGFLHLGHAYSALRNFDYARKRGGRFLLRIEDIDIARARPEFEQAILEDLAWLGISWEDSVRKQSEHLDEYAIALEKLSGRGVLYACDCTRAKIADFVKEQVSWPRDPDGSPVYPGFCRDLTPAERVRRTRRRAFAQRLDMNEAIGLLQGPLGWEEFGEMEYPRTVSAQPSVWGDIVVGRKDIPGSYHVAVVVDDALQGVTDVIRGMDLFEATSLHRLLQEMLDLPAPCYHHHKLVLNSADRKLSKSEKAQSLRDLRAQGVRPDEIRIRLGLPPA